MRLNTSTPQVFRALRAPVVVKAGELFRLLALRGRRGRDLLLVFVQSGLQQVEGVHQPRGEAALFSRRSSEPLRLGQGPVQVELLLGLFADQLSLIGSVRTRSRRPEVTPPRI